MVQAYISMEESTGHNIFTAPATNTTKLPTVAVQGKIYAWYVNIAMIIYEDATLSMFMIFK